jgi:hypothetical protein
MKKKVVFAFLLLNSLGLYAQTGIGTNLPHITSVLEVASTEKGLLIPRVTLLNETDKNTIKGGTYPESLLVYHTGNASLSAGYYYWEKDKWNAIVSNTTLTNYVKNLAGDVSGKLDNNTVDKIKGVSVSNTGPTTTGQALVYNATTKMWEAGKPKVDGIDIGGKATLSTDGIIVVGDATSIVTTSNNSLLNATKLSIKNESITSTHILNKTIQLEDMKNGSNNAVLTTTATGDLQWEARTGLGDVITATNGITKTLNNIELGGALTKPTEITTSATNTLAIKGMQKAAVTDVVVMTDGSGVLKQRKSAMPSFFNMPSVVLPTAEGQTTQAGITFNNATRTGTIDLYLIYKNQFTTPVRSSAATAPLPVLAARDLVYHITYIDTTVFTITGLTVDGKLTYTVSATAKSGVASFANIVFAVNN